MIGSNGNGGGPPVEMLTAETSSTGEMDEETKALIDRGYVPTGTSGPFGRSRSWDRPTTQVITWPAVALILGFMSFIIVTILVFRLT